MSFTPFIHEFLTLITIVIGVASVDFGWEKFALLIEEVL
jgi:hypothetical protein